MGLTAFLLDERTLVLSVQFLIVSHAPFRASDVKAAYLPPHMKKKPKEKNVNKFFDHVPHALPRERLSVQVT